jgi:transposase
VNRLNVTDKERILGLLALGRSHRAVARQTGHSRTTVLQYGREAGILKAPPSWKSRSARDAARAGNAGRSRCEPYRAFIEAEALKGRQATRIYQDLVEHHGYSDSYEAVKRFVRTLQPKSSKVSTRFETLAGQEAQVDYGEGALTLDARTGRYRRPRLFIMTLGMSRHAFRKVVWNSSQEIWCRLHEEAFAFFGGVPETIRLDNLREGVIKPDIYDPELNPLYAAMLNHYSVVPLPCRPYSPDLKGKVESQIAYTQNAFAGERFASLDDHNIALAHWNERWAFTRVHGTTKRRVCDMFEEERAVLRPLPTTRFEYYRIAERPVHLDGHIEIAGAYYSVPLPCIGQTVVVHVGTLWLRVLDRSSRALLREHAIAQKGERRTCDLDRPPQTPPSTLALHRRCEEISASAGSFALNVLTERGIEAQRTLLGLLDLARRYEQASVETACALALQAGSTRLSFLRGYLTRHGRLVSLHNDHRVIPEFQRYIVHFNTSVAKGVIV